MILLLLLALILFALGLTALLYAWRVHRRGWCKRKGGGRILREKEPAVFWVEVVGVAGVGLVALWLSAYTVWRLPL